MISILLVEDHEIFAQALLRVLNQRGQIDVVAIATSAEDALNQLPSLNVDLVLVDVSLPHQSGISLVLTLQQSHPHLPCVMLSGHVSKHYARSSLAAGARGYLVKDRADEILEGIDRVLHGEIYLSEEVR
jgi:DNA-binding NarL/FixJ family response regulator